MKNVNFILLLFFISGCTIFTILPPTDCTIKSPKKIVKPGNISKSSILYAYFDCEINDYNYYWVNSYLIDSLNDIFEISSYTESGEFIEKDFYFTVKKEVISDTIKDFYLSGIPFGELIHIAYRQQKYILISFNYLDTLDYLPDIIKTDFEKYYLVRAVEINKNYIGEISPTSYGKTYIKTTYTNDSLFQISILSDNYKYKWYEIFFPPKNEYKLIQNIYKLKSEDNIKKQDVKYPFKFKYYNIDNKRIYLINKGYYLELVN